MGCSASLPIQSDLSRGVAPLMRIPMLDMLTPHQPNQQPQPSEIDMKNRKLSIWEVNPLSQQKPVPAFLPQPRPPRKKKNEIFKIEDHAEIDDRAQKVPTNLLYKPFEDLTTYLLSGVSSDVARVRSLFTWITSIDIASLQYTLVQLPDPGTPLDYLLKIHWNMGNQANIFAKLCRAADIPCYVISGVNKSAAYQIGSQIRRKVMGAQWNAVLVDREWRLVDVFWASTCIVGKKLKDWALVDIDGESPDNKDDDEDDGEGQMQHRVNDFFFLTDPELLVHTHLPDDPKWQLLSEPVELSEFEEEVYMRERFHELSIRLTGRSHDKCLVSTVAGEIELYFEIIEADSPHMEFKYMLFKQRSSSDENQPFIHMDQFVLYQKSVNSLKYLARFPVTGKFKIDIFGRDTRKHNTLDLTCSYVITCSEAMKNCQPLPHLPDIGWGPGTEAMEVGLQAKTHSEAVIDSQDGHVEIRFGLQSPLSVLQSLRHNDLDEWLLKRQGVIRIENGEMIIELRLPKAGEYALNLFANAEKKEGQLPNVCNYLIRCQNEGLSTMPFPSLHEGILGKGHLSEKLGIQPLTHETGHIITKDGKLAITFSTPDHMELFAELHCVSSERRLTSEEITRIASAGTATFNMDLQNPGEYGLNVYAKKKGEDNRLYHVHTYLVDYIPPETQTSNKGATAIQDEPPVEVLYSHEDQIEIKLQTEHHLVGELQRKNAQESPEDNQLNYYKEGEENVFKIRLPELGEYTLNVHETSDTGALVHLKSYHIIKYELTPEEIKAQNKEIDNAKEKDPKMLKQEAKKREMDILKEELKVAMSSKDPQVIQAAIEKCEKEGLADDKIEQARKLLKYIEISNALTKAMSDRNLKNLEAAIKAAEVNQLQKKLGLQLGMGQRLLEQLNRIEKLKHEIMKLDQRTIAEIKSYSKPPEGVHQVMSATFVILGNDINSLKDWKSVVVLIGKTGKESLKRRVGEFQVDKMKIQVALLAKRILSQFLLEEVRSVSSGAATFYAWSQGMIDEAESRFIQAGGDLSTLQDPKLSKNS